MKTKKAKQNATAVVGATPSVLGPTPLSDIPLQRTARLQKRAGLEEDLATGFKQPATIKTVNFHKVPPRTEIVEKENAQDGTEPAEIRFKESSKAQGAPAGLGEISATIWARTAASKGGGKDPTAAPFAKAANIMSERIELEQDAGDVLLSADGFRAYAHEMVWGVRAPGETDDAPLDEGDPLQVRGRLRELWRSWRRLPAEDRKRWTDGLLAQQLAVNLSKAAGASKGGKATAVPGSRPGKSKSKKSDGWGYVAAPKHKAPKAPKAVAAATDTEKESEEQQQQAPAPGKPKKDSKKRKDSKTAPAEAAAGAADNRAHDEAAVDRAYDAVDVDDGKIDEEYRRAEALRYSKIALMSEMRMWEEEDELQEAAGAAGMSAEDLRKQRKEAADAAKEAEVADGAAADEGQDDGGAAAAGSSRAAASRNKKRKAVPADTKKKPAGTKPTRHSTRKPQQQAEEASDEDDDMADASDDEEAAAAAEEAVLERAMAEADDSDDDADDNDDEDDATGEEEEDERPPPAKKARMRAAAAPQAKSKAGKAISDKPTKTSKRKEKSTKQYKAPAEPAQVAAAAAAAAPAKPAAKKKDANSKDKPEGPGKSKSQGSKKRKAAKQEPAAAADTEDKPGTSAAAAAASGSSRQRSKASAKAAASPSRKSQRQQKEAESTQQPGDEDDGPAASGAGKSSGPRRGRSAGGAQSARIDHLEKSLFSNTRRSSYGRADSPGLARAISDAVAAEAASRPSRLGKVKK